MVELDGIGGLIWATRGFRIEAGYRNEIALLVRVSFTAKTCVILNTILCVHSTK
jgi:hypothetical protein